MQIFRSTSIAFLLLAALTFPLAARQAPAPPSAVVPKDTPLIVRLDQAIDTKSAGAGTSFSATLAEDVKVNGHVAIPKGTVATGQIEQAQNSGKVSGSALLTLGLVSLSLNGKQYPLNTLSYTDKSGPQARKAAKHAMWGALAGAAIGAIADGKKGAAEGAGAGAAVGVATTGKSRIQLPAEEVLAFRLSQPLSL